MLKQDNKRQLTPLAGLVMGTRSGDMDPAIMPYLNQVNTMYNQIGLVMV